jgi:hypothetical protein
MGQKCPAKQRTKEMHKSRKIRTFLVKQHNKAMKQRYQEQRAFLKLQRNGKGQSKRASRRWISAENWIFEAAELGNECLKNGGINV